jgi:hypothetical protein
MILNIKYCKFDMNKSKRVYRKKCRGGFTGCKIYVGEHKDVDGAGYCESCDNYIDENPWDPYWEHMEQEFGESEEYAELEKAGLVEDYDAYEKAYEKYQANYEKWPVMRRRMAEGSKKK